ncbi:MAG: calcium-binding protein [Actinomycetota bacterium]
MRRRAAVAISSLVVSTLPLSSVSAEAQSHTARASVRVEVHGLLEFHGNPGSSDHLLVASRPTTDGRAQMLVMSSADLRAGRNCIRRAPRPGTVGFPYRVVCARVQVAHFFLGNGNDALDSGNTLVGPRWSGSDVVPRVILGGPGNDDLFGGGGQDLIRGGSGDDELFGGVGNDEVYGGLGNDSVGIEIRHGEALSSGGSYRGGPGRDSVSGAGETLGGPGPDVLSGSEVVDGGSGEDVLLGSGPSSVLIGGRGADEMQGLGPHDEVDFSRRAADITVSDDGIPNDGAPGEGDNVLPAPLGVPSWGVEVVVTGSGNDTVSMSGRRERLSGNGGDDTLTLHGGSGAAFGGPGNDTLSISGAPGRLRGASGNDQLSSADGSTDHDGCGPGTDAVTADASDVVNTNCEDVTVTP